MNKEQIEHLTRKAVLDELSQTELDGREILDFDEVLNVVISVVKNCSIPDVNESLPTRSEIEIAIKNYADEKICKGDSSARWYDIQYNFRAGVEWVMKRLTK